MMSNLKSIKLILVLLCFNETVNIDLIKLVLRCCIFYVLCSSFRPGSTDWPDRGGVAALGAGSCSRHLFLQEEVRSPVILKSNASFFIKSFAHLHGVPLSSISWLSLILNQFDVCCREAAAKNKSALFRLVVQAFFQIHVRRWRQTHSWRQL